MKQLATLVHIESVVLFIVHMPINATSGSSFEKSLPHFCCSRHHMHHCQSQKVVPDIVCSAIILQCENQNERIDQSLFSLQILTLMPKHVIRRFLSLYCEAILYKPRYIINGPD